MTDSVPIKNLGHGINTGMHLTEYDIRRLVRVSRHFKYAFIANPKVASSTLKWTLWEAEYKKGAIDTLPRKGTIDSNDDSPFDVGYRCLFDPDYYRFSFVRNPFDRTLSAWMNIIRDNGRMKHYLLKLVGINKDRDISFADFLYMIMDVRDDLQDFHWRSQAMNLFLDVVPYNFIGKVECLEADLAHVMASVFGQAEPVKTHAPHRTGARKSVGDYYTRPLMAIVSYLFREDFIRFNYDDYDLHADPTAPIALSEPCLAADFKHFIEGVHLIQAKEFSRAIDKIDEAIAIAPQRSNYHYNRGVALFLIGRLAQAEKAFQKAIELDPKSRSMDLYQYYLSMTLERQGQYDNAVQAAFACVGSNLEQHPFYLRQLAKVLESAGRLSEAADIWRRCIAQAESIDQSNLENYKNRLAKIIKTADLSV